MCGGFDIGDVFKPIEKVADIVGDVTGKAHKTTLDVIRKVDPLLSAFIPPEPETPKAPSVPALDAPIPGIDSVPDSVQEQEVLTPQPVSGIQQPRRRGAASRSTISTSPSGLDTLVPGERRTLLGV